MPTPRIQRVDRPRVVELRDDATEVSSEPRPVDRDQCRHGVRPCPFVGCRHHLYLNYPDGRDHRGVVVNFPALEPWEIPETCALDVADRGDLSLEEVGLLLNLSKSGVEKIVNKALAVLRRRLRVDELQET